MILTLIVFDQYPLNNNNQEVFGRRIKLLKTFFAAAAYVIGLTHSLSTVLSGLILTKRRLMK